MKLRCIQNSIRIRLRKSEVEQLAADKFLEERISFGGGVQLRFALSLTMDTPSPKAFFQDHQILLSIPEKSGLDWIHSEQVGIEAFQDIEEKEQLHLLIEKDFPCKDRPDEDKADTFQELALKNEDKFC